MRGSNATPLILLCPLSLLSFLPLLLVIISPVVSATPLQAPLPSPSPRDATAAIPFTLRNATLDDIDDITTVQLDAFRPAPTWKYVRQFADDVDPLYTWTCQRDGFLVRLQDEALSLKATVITVPDPDPAATRERVVSVAIWDFNQTRRGGEGEPPYVLSPTLPSLPAGVHGSSASGFNCSAHLDVNMTRALHLLRHMTGAVQEYLREPRGRQLYLELLATHPDWDGNGFAAAHLRWGKAQLARLGGGGGSLPLTLMSTPAGYPLYVSEGFEGQKNVTVERLDGEGVFWHEAMKFEDGGGGADEL